MVELLPSALVIIPAVIISSFRRKWALFFLALMTPFFDVVVVTIVSHQFHPAELAVLALGANQLYRWISSEQITISWPSSFTWFSIFVLVSCLSIIYLAISTPSISVNPYGIYPGNFERLPVKLSRSNITQLLLRLFTISAIGLIVLSTRMDEVETLVRILVLGGIFSGITGVLYQISVILNISIMPGYFQWLGSGLRDLGGYGFLGPVPRMGSMTGEPGHIAQYLIYIFSVVLILTFINTQQVFTKKRLTRVSLLLFALLLLTTSSTAYGGVLILVTVLVALYWLLDVFDRARFRAVTISTIASMLVMTPLLLTIPSMKSIFVYQVEKLLFQAGSGSIRVKYFQQTLETVSIRPIFGIGTGSYYPTSLLGTFLGETGLLGTVSFLTGCVTSVRHSFYLGKNKLVNYEISVALSGGLLTILLTSLVAKSVTSLLSPWFWFAIALPIVFMIGDLGQGGSGESPDSV